MKGKIIMIATEATRAITPPSLFGIDHMRTRNIIVVEYGRE